LEKYVTQHKPELDLHTNASSFDYYIILIAKKEGGVGFELELPELVPDHLDIKPSSEMQGVWVFEDEHYMIGSGRYSEHIKCKHGEIVGVYSKRSGLQKKAAFEDYSRAKALIEQCN
jgi:hypothetical protein